MQKVKVISVVQVSTRSLEVVYGDVRYCEWTAGVGNIHLQKLSSVP